MPNKSNSRPWSRNTQSLRINVVLWILAASTGVGLAALIGQGTITPKRLGSLNTTPIDPNVSGPTSSGEHIDQSKNIPHSAGDQHRPKVIGTTESPQVYNPEPAATVRAGTAPVAAHAPRDTHAEPLSFYDLQTTRPASPAGWNPRDHAPSSKIHLPDQAEINLLRDFEIKGEARDNIGSAKPALVPQDLSPQEKKTRKQRELARIKREMGMPAPEHHLTSDLYDPWATEYNSLVRKEKDRAEQLAEDALRARQAENTARRKRVN